MFANRLTTTLTNKNISQTELANELGFTQQAINRWCRGITQPDHKTIVLIAKYLGVSTDFLLGNDEKPSNYEEELKEQEALKKALQKSGFMEKDEDLTDEELDRLMKFVNANKEFLKDNK